MKLRYGVVLAVVCLVTQLTGAQGMMSDVLLGKLINPEVGAYAWYTLKDQKTGQEYFLRQAIVATEKIKRKDGWWLETELVPRVGFASVYKMLLTGPASDPGNVERLLVREGNGAVQEIGVEEPEKNEAEKDVPRESVGLETIALASGEIEAEHFIVKDGEPPTEIWISEAVPLMGLVKMKTSEGELVLQRYGKGGKDGQSALQESGVAAPSAETSPDVVTAPEEPPATGQDTEKSKKKSNISPRKRAR